MATQTNDNHQGESAAVADKIGVLSGVKVEATGWLVRDPDNRPTPKGISQCEFRIGCGKSNRDEDSGRDGVFKNVKAFGNLADFCAQHLSKSDMVIVTGFETARKYKKNDERKRFEYIVAGSVSLVVKGAVVDTCTHQK